MAESKLETEGSYSQGLFDLGVNHLDCILQTLPSTSYLHAEIDKTIGFLQDLEKISEQNKPAKTASQSIFHHDKSEMPVFYFLNLAFRTDRRELIQKISAKLGIYPSFVPAIHGAKSEVAKAIYDTNREYALELVRDIPDHALKYSISAYKDYLSEPQRERYFYEKWNGKLLSYGSIGYLLSFRKALIASSINQRSSASEYIVVCDDDVRPHKDFWDIWDKTWCQIKQYKPLIISLGAMQYFWDTKDISWASDNAYRCNGTSIASHATILHKSLVAELIQLIDCSTLPLDIGALHYLKRKYSSQTFVVYPNLFIQDVSESDIADTGNQSREGVKADNIFKWNLVDYCFDF